jgi:pyruvate dehydrogenase (quinone)
VPAQVRHVVDRALRIALAERTVTAIVIPNDLQIEEAVDEPPRIHGSVPSGIGYVATPAVPPAAQLQHAANVLNAGSKVAMLVGAGALGATQEVIATADALGAGIAKALLGKAAVPDDVPNVTGSIGLLGTRPSWDMMNDCDTLLMVGSSFPYSEFLPREGQARGVQIDIDARMLSLRYPMEVNLVGDSRATLQALLPLLERKTDRSWQDELEGKIRDWWQLIGERAMDSADPINPQRVFHELSPLIPDGAIVSSDSGSSADWYARHVRLRTGMRASLSGNLATMGPGVPYAIAAKFAHPDRVAIALVGDGAMQMNGNAELLTVGKYWRRWSDPRLVVCVLHNNDLNQVTWEQRVFEGDPKFEGSQDLPDFAYARYAELCGLRGIRVDDPDDLAGAWQEAFAADRPTLIEAITDPNVPPLPPHISFEQARQFMSSMVKGDPDLVGMVKQATKQFVEGVLPR